MKKNIFLDTQILVFGIQKNGRNSQGHMVKRAEALFEKFDQEKSLSPMISSIVLAELLLKVPPEEHDKVLTEVDKYFKISSFDTKSALLSARILYEKTEGSGKSLNELCKEENGSRDHLKIDSMITANAKSNNAVVLYSEDHHIKKFAEGIVSTSSLPTDPQQLSWLENIEQYEENIYESDLEEEEL